jgi:hypothetical protein
MNTTQDSSSTNESKTAKTVESIKKDPLPWIRWLNMVLAIGMLVFGILGALGIITTKLNG